MRPHFDRPNQAAGDPPHRKAAPAGSGREGRAFTLLELVLVLTLLALLTAAAVPTVHGMREAAVAREPLNALAKLAKETRLKAMRDRRPYQIAFTSNGFRATRYFSPYLQAAELEAFIQRSAIETQQKEEAGILPAPSATGEISSGTAAPTGVSTAPVFRDWTETVTMPEGMVCSVREWHEAEAIPVAGDAVKLWVFQPSGMVTPLSVTLQLNNRVITADFSALTADIIRETQSEL